VLPLLALLMADTVPPALDVDTLEPRWAMELVVW
jgi:hypothetical protein